FFQAEDGIRDKLVTGVQTCALPIFTGRISTVPQRPAGISEAIRMASSKSLASTRKNPPSCSRVSAKGPSVTNRFPSRVRTLVARSDERRVGKSEPLRESDVIRKMEV